MVNTDDLNVFQNLPIGVAWKDEHSIIRGCNHFALQIAGLLHQSEIIGKTDFEIGLEEEDAHIFVEDDRSILHTEQAQYNVLRFARYPKGQSV